MAALTGPDVAALTGPDVAALTGPDVAALTGPDVLRNLEEALEFGNGRFSVSGVMSRLSLSDLTVFISHIEDDDAALERFLNAALEHASAPEMDPETDLEFSSYWGAPAPENDLGFVSEASDVDDDDFTLSEPGTPMDVD